VGISALLGFRLETVSRSFRILSRESAGRQSGMSRRQQPRSRTHKNDGNAGSGGEHEPPLTIFTEQICPAKHHKRNDSSQTAVVCCICGALTILFASTLSTKGDHFAAWEQPELLAAEMRGIQTIALVEPSGRCSRDGRYLATPPPATSISI